MDGLIPWEELEERIHRSIPRPVVVGGPTLMLRITACKIWRTCSMRSTVRRFVGLRLLGRCGRDDDSELPPPAGRA